MCVCVCVCVCIYVSISQHTSAYVQASYHGRKEVSRLKILISAGLIITSACILRVNSHDVPNAALNFALSPV
jgi:hypothetical protein